MCNIYLIKLNKCGYDEYRGFVVVASARKRAIEIAKKTADDYAQWESGFKVSLIGSSKRKEGIVLSDFKAG